MSNDPELSHQLVAAVESEDLGLAETVIRGAELIVFQQINEATGEVEEDEEGNFNVVLARMDDELAVVCFVDHVSANEFVENFSDEIPEGAEWPRAYVDGSSLLDNLPADCGLLVNPGGEQECYFEAGTFGA